MSNPSRNFVICVVEKMIAMLVLLILKPGTGSAASSVSFENPNPCALKGSSVEFRCSYSYPDGQNVSSAAWYKGQLKDGSWKRVELSDLPSYQNRSEYLGDLQHDCSLAIRDLQDNDTGHYYVRFDTNMYGVRSKESVYLSVTELTALVNPNTVRVGDNVTLKCETSCQLPSKVWFKDGRPVGKTEFQAQAEDAGNYVCAVEGHEAVLSDPVALDVQYPPLNVSVEVSHPGPLTVNSSVNLTCSSASNPAAVNYTWYKRTASPSIVQVGSEQVLSIPTVEASHAGLYLCQARNQVGETNSTEVLLTVDETDSEHTDPPLNVSVEVSRPGPLTVKSSVNLTCSSASNPAAVNYTWYKRTASPSIVQVGSGQVLSIPTVEASHAGLYLCQARNQVGETNSTEVLLTVDETDNEHTDPPLNVSVEVSHPGPLTVKSSVNLTCSSASNPAAVNYTWYKRTASPSIVQVGSGQVLSIPTVEASHAGLYLCQARNQVGETNSTEVLLTVDETDSEHTASRLILLVGIVIKVVVLLLLTLAIILVWRHKRTSAVVKEENSNDYENITMPKWVET